MTIFFFSELFLYFFFFFFNDTATTEIYTLSLHDALPIYHGLRDLCRGQDLPVHGKQIRNGVLPRQLRLRSEEHTSELQSRLHLVCRLLLEKKKKKKKKYLTTINIKYRIDAEIVRQVLIGQ